MSTKSNICLEDASFRNRKYALCASIGKGYVTMLSRPDLQNLSLISVHVHLQTQTAFGRKLWDNDADLKETTALKTQFEDETLILAAQLEVHPD